MHEELEPKELGFRTVLRQVQINKIQNRLRRRRVQVESAFQVLPLILGL